MGCVYTGRIFVDYRTAVPSYVNGAGTVDVITGIALASNGGGPASLTLTLRDSAGNVLASGLGTLAAGAHIARFINQMSDIAPGFSLPANFATAIGYGSLEITSNRSISVVAMRLAIDQRHELLYSAAPSTQLGLTSGNTLYFPQVADGGGYSTQIVLLSDGQPAIVAVSFLDDTGSPLAIGRGPF